MAVVTYGAKRCAVRGTIGDIEVVNVFNVDSSYGVEAVANTVGQAYGNRFGPVLANSYAFGDIRVIDMSDPAGDTATQSLAEFENGDLSSAVEVGLVAVIRWEDSISGRAFRPGRTFFGPLPQSAVQGLGLDLAPSYKALLQAAADGFLTDMGDIDGSLVIVHGMGTPNQQLAPVTGVSVADRLGHLDSRRR